MYSRSAGLRVGADWSEREEGTNGIGTCIAENRPVIVYREEHFRACHIGLSCSGAPIRDASAPAARRSRCFSTLNARRHASQSGAHHGTGQPVGAADREMSVPAAVPGRDRVPLPRPPRVREHCSIAARLRSLRMAEWSRSTRPHCWLLRAKSRETLVGRGIDEIFDVSPSDLIEPTGRTQLSLRPVRDVLFGRHFFLSSGSGFDRDTRAHHPAAIARDPATLGGSHPQGDALARGSRRRRSADGT